MRNTYSNHLVHSHWKKVIEKSKTKLIIGYCCCCRLIWFNDDDVEKQAREVCS